MIYLFYDIWWFAFYPAFKHYGFGFVFSILSESLFDTRMVLSPESAWDWRYEQAII
jgi:hypothetical protein